jgi:hypothetical protein
MPEAHFATFPEKLIEPCILAGTSEKGCCVECGAPWERVVENKFIPQQDVSLEKGIRCASDQKPMDDSNSWGGTPRGNTESKTIGWKPTCKCETPGTRDEKLAKRGGRRCTVLDPFIGAGTTFVVSYKHNRKCVGIDLSETYLKDIAIPRIQKETQQMRLF